MFCQQIRNTKYNGIENKGSKNLQLLAPILRCKRCCIRGPKAPNRCGGRPLASRSACRRPTSLSSLSESAPCVDGPPPLGTACAASCGEGGSSDAAKKIT